MSRKLWEYEPPPTPSRDTPEQLAKCLLATLEERERLEHDLEDHGADPQKERRLLWLNMMAVYCWQKLDRAHEERGIADDPALHHDTTN